MPKGLRRFYGGGDLHFITCSCYQRKPFLGSAARRDLFLNIFEEVRQKYEFQVVGQSAPIADIARDRKSKDLTTGTETRRTAEIEAQEGQFVPA